ncbi:hypothetical protein LWI28_004437 [Acer negundo]|uniref:Response regulatory domain-containing protein n=1 Tax=Acer negundo TaxID=4023 RepID=A0AAD5NF74_ACENE|nr:hypothetical protein LWI28_004437 [Acer negundo]KAK4836534.1 hypothetical protein QYF36_024407 [Acer negundo]
MGMAAADAQFHVLAVDDSIIDRKLIERLLKTSSYQVTAVDSVRKALEFLGILDDDDQEDHVERNPNPTSVSPDDHDQDIQVNLIITDYCMPGMTGYDLLRKIKESASFKDIPVVIMSSENVPSRINRCLEEGAEEFFLKPVQLADVNKLKPHLLKGKSRENQPNINKRKGLLEEIHSPDRTRTRYNNNNNNNNGLQVV